MAGELLSFFSTTQKGSLVPSGGNVIDGEGFCAFIGRHDNRKRTSRQDNFHRIPNQIDLFVLTGNEEMEMGKKNLMLCQPMEGSFGYGRTGMRCRVLTVILMAIVACAFFVEKANAASAADKPSVADPVPDQYDYTKAGSAAAATTTTTENTNDTSSWNSSGNGYARYYAWGGYTIHNGVLQRAYITYTRTWNNVTGWSGYTASAAAWDSVDWKSDNNNVNITSGDGNATSGPGPGITGSGNAVAINGNGHITGNLTLYDDNDAGNWLYIGYNIDSTTRDGITNAPDVSPEDVTIPGDVVIDSGSTVDVGRGTVFQRDGTVEGTIKAENGSTSYYHSGGNMSGNVLMDGNGAYSYLYRQSGGTQNGTVDMNGDGTDNHYYISSGTISGTGAINMNGTNSIRNRFTQTGGSATGEPINMNGDNTKLNIYQQTGGTNNSIVKIGDDGTQNALANTDKTSIHGIYFQSGGTKYDTDAGAGKEITITGGQNLFWLHGDADYRADAAINSGTTTFTGNNVVVVDLNNSHNSGTGHAMTGTIDMSGTNATNATGERNNLFLANGDIVGKGTGASSQTITTAAGNSKNYVYVGYTMDKTGLGNTYSWYGNNAYDLTGLSSSPEGSGVTGIPDSSNEYFNMGQINDSDATGHLNVKKILGSGGELHVQVTAGDAYNIKGTTALQDNEIDSALFDPTRSAGYDYAYMIPYSASGLYGNYPADKGNGNAGLGNVPAGYQDFKYTTDFSNNRNYQVYSILNQDVVNVGAYVDDNGSGDTLYLSPTDVTIGAIRDKGTDATAYDNDYGAIDLSGTAHDLAIATDRDNHSVNYYENGTYEGHNYKEWYDGHQAQITAGMVNVYAGSKMTLHLAYGITDPTASATTNNIIDNLNIIGAPASAENCNDCGYTSMAPYVAKVTIDRTTVHTLTEGTTITHDHGYYKADRNGNIGLIDASGSGPGYLVRDDYTANVVVGTNGILQGFSTFTSATDHTAAHANVLGDVAILSGGMIRPYDAEIFVVHGNTLQYEAGTDPNHLYDNTNPARPDYIASLAAFEANANKLKGVQFRVDAGSETEGRLYFEHASRLSTRLFAQEDGTDLNIISSDGTDTDKSVAQGFTPQGSSLTVQRYWGDSVSAVDLDFSEVAYNSIYLKDGIYNVYTPGELANPSSVAGGIASDYYTGINTTDIASMKKLWTGMAQHNKVQYVPVFGFVNELKSKLEYQIYQGDDQSGIKSYYYNVAVSDNVIPELVYMDDANHLFNRDVLFSDMLGQWNFEKTADNKGIILRYRMTAKHPHQGGLTIDQRLRNSREVARKMDEIRYPFRTAYNMADHTLDGLFFQDPSLDGWYVDANGNIVHYDTPYQNGSDTHGYDGNPYDTAGFNGDIEEYYRDNQARFGNYRADWVHDIEVWLRAFQLNVDSMAEAHRSLRLISAEPYASQANADLATMNSFIASRERNGQSALWLVEQKHRELEQEAVGDFQKPLEADMPVGYVDNPLRIWTAALGNRYNQRGVGDEYGYHSQSYGVQIGAIKEIGDAYFGLTGGYTRATNRWSELQAKNKANNYMGEALVGLRRGLGFLELHANAGYMDHKMGRDLTHGANLNDGSYNPALDCDLFDNYYNGVYSVQHTGNFHNRVLGGGMRLGYQWVVKDKWLFLPTVGVRFQDIRNASSFTEDGPDNAAFRLVFNKGGIKRQSLQIPVMLRISRGIAFNNGGPTILTPELRIGATVEAMDRGGEVDFKWRGNPIPERWMKAWGIEEDRVSFQAGATIELSRRGRFYAALNYDLNYQKKNFNHNFSIQSGLNF